MAIATFINLAADANPNREKAMHFVTEHTSSAGDFSVGIDRTKFTSMLAIDQAWAQVRLRLVGSGLK
jgi:hypothetical protein